MSEWNNKSTEAWSNAWGSKNTGSSISSIATGLSGIFNSAMANAKTKDINVEEAEARAVGATQFSSGSYDNLLEQFNVNNLARKNYTRKELRGLNGWQMAGNTLSSIASGASAGASVGGPWGAVAGAVVGLGTSLGGIFAGNAKADQKASHLNYLGIENNRTYLTNYSNSVSNTHDMKFNGSLLNMSNAAYGGPLFNHSENFDNGIIFINEGGTHEQNPFGGVPVGVDQEGIPNLVEEGEVIWNDYVFSNRLKPTKKQLANNGYGDKYQDLTFAKLVERLQDSERVNDTISKESLNDSMSDLIRMQEEVRIRKRKNVNNKFDIGGPTTIVPAIHTWWASLIPILERIKADQNNPLASPPPIKVNSPITEGPKNEIETVNNEKRLKSVFELNEDPIIAENERMAIQNLFDKVEAPIQKYAGINPLEAYVKVPTLPESVEVEEALIDESPIPSTSPVTKAIVESTVAKNPEVNYNYNNRFKTPKQLAQERAKELGIDFNTELKIPNYQPLVQSVTQTVNPKTTAPSSVQPGKPYSVKTSPGFSFVEDAKASKSGVTSTSTSTPTKSSEYKGSQVLISEEDLPSAPETKGSNDKDNGNESENSFNVDWLRYTSPLIHLGSFINNLKKPDYSNANRIERAAQQIPGGSFTPLGNFINLEPLDRNYYLNPLLSTSRSNARNIQNSAVNAGQAMSGLLANNYNTQRNIGATLMQMEQENMNRELQEATFNRGTHQANAQMGLQALAMDQQRANNILNATIQAANMRNALDAMRSQALSASLSGIVEDLGGIGRENMDRQTIKGLIDSGVLEDYLKAAGYSNTPAKNGGLLTKRKRRIR